MLIQIIYGLMFVLALFSALMVVLSPHAVYAALYLILTMVSIAGLFVLMNAQLAAAFQIIVYAGAIMVLFLFVIMLLNVGRQGAPSPHVRKTRWVGLGLAAAFALQTIGLLAGAVRPEGYTLANAPGVRIDLVAHRLITEYVYAFEMTSVLLLIAVVGAVALARGKLMQGAETAENGADERGNGI
jgi:NADH-quinone oxidoreductase subunit J